MNRFLFFGVLLAIAISGCQTTSSSQPSTEEMSPVATPSVTSTSPVADSPTPTPSGAEAVQQEAVQVIEDYYSAIDLRDYEQAYQMWGNGGQDSQQTFEEFKQGFANTASVAVEVGKPGESEGAAGSTYIEIPVTVTAVTRDNRPQRFSGSYTLRRVNDVPGSTPEQRQWHIYSATISQVN